MGKANVAATFMEHLCTCSAHGYSQSERLGQASKGSCYVECEGVTGEFYKGDRDCSSAIIDAWSEALRGSAYEGALSNATYTGNMRSVFVNSGLFEWKDMSFSAQRGDIYLNEANHTAMCIHPYGSAEGDILAEFSISETGGIYGTSGDQTGNESHLRTYYDYPWGGILHYNGRADGSGTTATSEGNTGASNATTTDSIECPRYRVYTKEYGWHPWMRGLMDEGGSTDNFAGAEGCWIYGFEVDGMPSGSWYKVDHMDGSIAENEAGNLDSPVTFITVYYKTPDPATTGYYQAYYRVHWLGDEPGWGKWERDDEDSGAGKDNQSPLDMVQLQLARA